MLLILCYHEIADSPNMPWVLSGTQLRAQLEKLLLSGFSCISLDALAEQPLNTFTNSFVVTFDDGRLGACTSGSKILMELGISGTYYLCTDFLNQKPVPQHEQYSKFADWKHAEKLLEDGHIIGSHSISHRSLIHSDSKQLRNEIHGSKQELESQLPFTCKHFAAPYGALSVEAINICKEVGYKTAVTGASGISSNPYFLKRESIVPEVDIDKLIESTKTAAKVKAIVTGTADLEWPVYLEDFNRLSRYDLLLYDSKNKLETLKHIPIQSEPLYAEDKIVEPAMAHFHHALISPSDRVEHVLTNSKYKSPYFLRFASVDDGPQINQLFNNVFNQNRNFIEWQWKYEHSAKIPVDGIGVIGEYEKRIVGSYLTIPYELVISGKRISATQPVDNCIEINHRELGLQRAIFELTYSQSFKHYNLAFGFPGGHHRELGIPKLHYVPITPLVGHTFSIVDFEIDATIRLAPITKFSEEHASFCNSTYPHDICRVNRTAEYLNWRYLQLPGTSYFAFEVRDEGILKAIFVIRQNGDLATLYELLIKPETMQNIPFCRLLFGDLQRVGIKQINTAVTAAHPLTILFQEFSSKPIWPDAYTLVISPQLKPFAEYELLKDPQKWWCILGDSDL